MTDQELKDLVAGNAIAISRLEKSQEGTDRQLKETDRKLNKTINMLKGMGVTQGDISEDLIYENFEILFEQEGKEFTKVMRNVDLPYNKGELDIIGVNGTEVLVTETKTRLTKDHINKFVNVSLPNFRKYMKKYDKYKLYGVVGTRVFGPGAKNYAFEKGLYVIKEANNGNAKILNSDKFKVKELKYC